MKRIVSCYIVLLMAACSQKQESTQNQSSVAVVDTVATDTKKEKRCFQELTKGGDITVINLDIDGNNINGQMNWTPKEKDGAYGNLTGTKNANGEMELLYDYMIEGSKQTETKIMKIENGKLHIKHGELIDPKNDGNLVFKDVTKATYSQTLDAVICK